MAIQYNTFLNIYISLTILIPLYLLKNTRSFLFWLNNFVYICGGTDLENAENPTLIYVKTRYLKIEVNGKNFYLADSDILCKNNCPFSVPRVNFILI